MDKLYAVFQELNCAYTTGADDIALRYIQLIHSSRAITVKTSLKSHKALRFQASRKNDCRPLQGVLAG